MTIRARLVGWLLLSLLPILCIGTLFALQANSTIAERASDDLRNLLQLELERLDNALDREEAAATRIAGQREFVDAVEVLAEEHPGNVGGPDARTDSPLAEAELDAAVKAGHNINDLRIVDRQGDELARSSGFSWVPGDDGLLERAMDLRRPLFGEAFVNGSDEERLGLVAPIVSLDGAVLGALLVETRLAPVVTQHIDTFDETSESFIVQRASEGVGLAISLRRFQRDAAFSARIDLDSQTPSARSLAVQGPQVFSALDYRGVETLAATGQLDRTGWGVVVKTDESEALAVARRLNSFILLALVTTVGVMLLGWFLQVQPLGRRILRTAEAANLISSGDYESRIDDGRSDEIGGLARGIDKLAGDLAVDIAAREMAESTLRHQANHDALTGLTNRQHISVLVDGRPTGPRASEFSVLFLDLDGFKEINDTHGHSIGDEVLVAVARRLTRSLPSGTSIARGEAMSSWSCSKQRPPGKQRTLRRCCVVRFASR